MDLEKGCDTIDRHGTWQMLRVYEVVGKRELASRADQRVLRWFEHMKRMDEYHTAKKVLMAEVRGGRVRGRPRLGWMDCVKVALGNGGMTVEAARQCTKDSK